MTRRTDAAETAWEHRCDRGALLSAQVGPAGTLLVEGYAAREGVLEYRSADGKIRRELVPAETLRASAGGLARAPVTLEHPVEDVSPQNYERLGVGDTDGEVSVERGGFVRVRLAVRRADAISAIKAGKQELSPGYRVRIDNTPGEHPVHGRYDCVQVERQYNHLAIVDQARGGREVRLRADASYSTETITGATPNAAGQPASAATPTPTHGGLVKPLITQLVALMGLGSTRFDGDDAALEAVNASLRQRADAVKAAEEAHATQLATVTAARDTATARADAAEAELTKLRAADAARADAAALADLGDLAKRLRVDSTKHTDAKSLRRAIAAAHMGAELKADASDAYVEALVDLARAASTSRGDGRDAGSRAFVPTQTAGSGANAAPAPARSLYELTKQRADALRLATEAE